MDRSPDTPPAARVLDVTRVLRRAGRVWTGVDRVELAYIDALIADVVPVYGLARTPFGYVLLDQSGLAAFRDRLLGRVPFSSPDLLSKIPRGLHPVTRAALTYIRTHAIRRCLPPRLAAMLRSVFPDGFAYLNVGHSNLSDRVLGAVRSVDGATVAVLVHDVIPLEYPEFQRDGTVDAFRDKMQRVRRYADLILYNSQDTMKRTQSVLSDWGQVPKGIVAHLGTKTSVPDADALPSGLPPVVPYFITVGTIEPRKNHALLLNIWAKMGADAPLLLICGGRGWKNKDVFGQLDALGPDARIREVSGLSDGALAALMSGAEALLFPSHAEGFGLPAVEALTLGTPVICSDLAVFREVLGKNAVYLDDSCEKLWHDIIVTWSKQAQDTSGTTKFNAPTWESHFKVALRLT